MRVNKQISSFSDNWWLFYVTFWLVSLILSTPGLVPCVSFPDITISVKCMCLLWIYEFQYKRFAITTVIIIIILLQWTDSGSPTQQCRTDDCGEPLLLQGKRYKWTRCLWNILINQKVTFDIFMSPVADVWSTCSFFFSPDDDFSYPFLEMVTWALYHFNKNAFMISHNSRTCDALVEFPEKGEGATPN